MNKTPGGSILDAKTTPQGVTIAREFTPFSRDRTQKMTVLGEHVLNPHFERSAKAREAVEHQCDQRPIA
jgi:hypothetical protein